MVAERAERRFEIRGDFDGSSDLHRNEGHCEDMPSVLAASPKGQHLATTVAAERNKPGQKL